MEEFISKMIFTDDRVLEILQTVTQKYIILTEQEIEKWNEDSLEFYINQKEQSNDIRGNYLRDKAKQLIASLSLRFGPTFEKFCGMIVGELQTPEMKDESIPS